MHESLAQKTTSRRIRVALYVLIFINYLGCQYDPYTWYYTKKKPSIPDLVGKYTLDDHSKKWLLEKPHQPFLQSYLMLLQDGTFVATFTAECWETMSEETKFFSGRWQFEQHQNRWALRLDVIELNGKLERHFLNEVMLLNQKAPYEIHTIIDDPDMGRGCTYIKEQIGQSL